jgi:hypothetical protein
MFLGEWKGEIGYWVTLDWFRTVTKASDRFPNKYWSAGTTSIEGDLTAAGFGKWFISVGGKGAVFTRLKDG